MKILSIDPSSTCTGYAVFEHGPDAPTPRLIEHGRLTAKSSLSALGRIDAIVEDVLDICIERRPKHVVIEIPSGKVAGRVRGRSGGTGLSVYGMAVGAIRQAMRQLDGTGGSFVHDALESTWIGTANRSKATRQLAARSMYPDYNPDTDTGGDAADAIMLGVWWCERDYVSRTEMR